MAIRIFSIEEALRIKDRIPGLVLVRAKQFLGSSGFSSDEGYLVIYESGEDIKQIYELAPNGLLDEEGFPIYEFIEAYIENDGRLTWEVVVQVSNSKTIAIFLRDQDCLDPDLRSILSQASVIPQPVPTLDGRAR
jgi:hypothetical protein